MEFGHTIALTNDFDIHNDEHHLLIKHSLIFSFYENQDIIKNALLNINCLLNSKFSALAIENLFDNEFEDEIIKLYDNKKYQNSLSFGFHIRYYADLIFNYFNCYNTKKYDFIRGIFYLID